MAFFNPEATTALDLELKGTTGSFYVKSDSDKSASVNVKYLLTHATFEFNKGHNHRLMQHLRPHREIFNIDDLEFEDIMQRDIDDARVTSELVPYLLDSSSRDIVKIFPPIIVIVLPIADGGSQPAKFYPQVFVEDDKHHSGEFDVRRMRSGDIGSEVFQFEQPISKGDVLEEHDAVRLRLNTSRSKLVIVDGQHRSMALLALFRNLHPDEWNYPERAPFKKYYLEWTQNYVRNFDLSHIKVPIMFCTFPELVDGYSGDMNATKAARSVFLTLNKTARKVTEARNKLLDDSDLIATCMRSILSLVKGKDARSSAIRLFNIELDQENERSQISTPVAFSGVPHFYYLTEHLLLNRAGDLHGIRTRRGQFSTRNELDAFGFSRRLQMRDRIGDDEADATKRDRFSRTTEKAVREEFTGKYAERIVSIYESFKPFIAFSTACLDLRERLKRDADQQLDPILFQGQGIGRVFEAHRKALKDRIKRGEHKEQLAEMQVIARDLDATDVRLKAQVNSMRVERAGKFIEGVSSELLKGREAKPGAVKFIDSLFTKRFTTVAFQCALVNTFFGVLDLQEVNTSVGIAEPQLDEELTNYIDDINRYFAPNTKARFERLVRWHSGEPTITEDDISFAATSTTFNAVMMSGEMKPDEWPKYRSVFLEIWSPKADKLKELVEAERTTCRNQAIYNLYGRLKMDKARELGIPAEDLGSEILESLASTAVADFRTYLTHLGVRLGDLPSPAAMKSAALKTYEPVPADVEIDEESDESGLQDAP